MQNSTIFAWRYSQFAIVSAGKRVYYGIAMDPISVGLLHMVEVAGGLHAGGDEERKKRLDELVAQGYLSLEAPRFRLPDMPAPEPTYRLTAAGKEFLTAEAPLA